LVIDSLKFWSSFAKKLVIDSLKFWSSFAKKLVKNHQKIGLCQKIGHSLLKFWSSFAKKLVIDSLKFWSSFAKKLVFRRDQNFGPYNIEPELYIYQNESNEPDTRNNTSFKQRQRPFKNIKRIVFVSPL